MNNKFPIFDEIDEFIMKYGLDVHYPRYRKHVYAEKLLYKVFNNLQKDEKIVLLGLKEEEIEYTAECIPDGMKNIETIIWNENDKQFEYLNSDSFKIYYVSRNGKEKIIKAFQKYKADIIDIYEIFASNNLYFEDDFYRILTDNVSFMPWDNDLEYKWDELYQMEYFINMRNYKNTNNSYLKCLYSEKCAFLSLLVRDFELFYYCGNLAMQSQSDINFKGLINELNKYLSECEKTIKQRYERDIIVFWIDAIPYGETENMKYWNEVKRKALSFHNMYTVTPNTKPTLRAMFCEKREVSDEGYKIKKINRKNSRLIRILEESNYEVKTISGYFGAIAKEIEVKKAFGFRTPASLILWNMLQKLLHESKKQFIICHLFAETHYPYISMGYDGYHKEEIIRRMTGENKVDNVLRCYSKFIPRNAISIYMSDHGKGRDLKSSHINFDIVSKDIIPCNNNNLLSVIDFCSIISNLVEGNEIINNKRTLKGAPIETLDCYSQKSAMSVLNKRLILSPYQFGYIGKVYDNYFAICFSNGVKWAVSANKVKEINPNPYEKEQVVGVSKKVFDGLPNYPTELFTSDSQKLYWTGLQHELYDLYLSRIHQRMRTIENSIDICRDSEVAIRMGGYHSFKLFNMLSSENKNKIGCFIDNNNQCLCSKTEKRIINMDEFQSETKKSVKAVILSSYDYLDMLRQEKKSGLYDDLNVIDIYEMFDELEIECQDVFYNALYEDDYISILERKTEFL